MVIFSDPALEATQYYFYHILLVGAVTRPWSDSWSKYTYFSISLWENVTHIIRRAYGKYVYISAAIYYIWKVSSAAVSSLAIPFYISPMCNICLSLAKNVLLQYQSQAQGLESHYLEQVLVWMGLFRCVSSITDPPILFLLV